MLVLLASARKILFIFLCVEAQSVSVPLFYIFQGLVDEQQKVRTITALAIAALAEAATPYGIESFDSVLKPLWKGIRTHRGKVCLIFISAQSSVCTPPVSVQNVCVPSCFCCGLTLLPPCWLTCVWVPRLCVCTCVRIFLLCTFLWVLRTRWCFNLSSLIGQTGRGIDETFDWEYALRRQPGFVVCNAAYKFNDLPYFLPPNINLSVCLM